MVKTPAAGHDEFSPRLKRRILVSWVTSENDAGRIAVSKLQPVTFLHHGYTETPEHEIRYGG